jgi:hypothetical protein
MSAVVAAGSFGLYRNSRISTNFNSVRGGWSDNQVVDKIGKPSWIEPCGKSFGTPKQNCTEYIYRNSFAPILPKYWSVSFDKSRRVVDTYVYESP